MTQDISEELEALRASIDELTERVRMLEVFHRIDSGSIEDILQFAETTNAVLARHRKRIDSLEGASD